MNFNHSQSISIIQKMKISKNRTVEDESYLFDYKEREYCQAHTLSPYHGIKNMKYRYFFI